MWFKILEQANFTSLHARVGSNSSKSHNGLSVSMSVHTSENLLQTSLNTSPFSSHGRFLAAFFRFSF